MPRRAAVGGWCIFVDTLGACDVDSRPAECIGRNEILGGVVGYVDAFAVGGAEPVGHQLERSRMRLGQSRAQLVGEADRIDSGTQLQRSFALRGVTETLEVCPTGRYNRIVMCKPFERNRLRSYNLSAARGTNVHDISA